MLDQAALIEREEKKYFYLEKQKIKKTYQITATTLRFMYMLCLCGTVLSCLIHN